MYEVTKCRITTKTRYSTPGDAKAALEKLKAYNQRFYDFISGKRKNKNRRKASQSRWFYCSYCSGFHLTSRKVAYKKSAEENLSLDWKNLSENLLLDEEQAKKWKEDSLPFPNTNKPL